MISKAFNPKSRDLTAYFPKWSAAYGDPNSAANKLLNPTANVLEYLDNTIIRIFEDSVVSRLDIDKHPFRRWIIEKEDISSFDTSFTTDANDFILYINSIFGTINGENITIIEANNNYEFYEPPLQTGWYIGGEIEHGLVGNMLSTAIDRDFFYIISDDNGEGQDPGNLYTLQLPHRWMSNLEKDETIQVINTQTDPVFETITLEFTVENDGDRVLLDHQLSDRSDKISVVDELASIVSGQTITTTDFIFIDTSDFRIGETVLGDIDRDGIIDQREIDEITANLNKGQSNFTAEEWESKYKYYDINGDSLINDDELLIVESLEDTIARDASALQFNKRGRYTVTYQAPINSLPATQAIYNERGEIKYFQNNTFGYLNQAWPESFIDATYDDDKDLYYYIDDATKCIWAYENNILGQSEDRIKIQLPINVNTSLRGITYFNYRIYVLAIIDSVPYIYTIRTDRDDISGNISRVPIHSGAETTGDEHVMIRDIANITEAASSLVIINGAKLATIEAGKIIFLLPLFDYYFQSTDANGNNNISFRENYESVTTSPDAVVTPVYWNLWNMLDTHGEEKGIRRIPGENNQSFKARILDVFEHFPSRDNQGILYGIQRELGLDIVESYNDPELRILNSTITKEIASGLTIFDDNVHVPWDDFTVENIYRYGKYTHDRITFIKDSQEILVIDGNTIE